MEELIVHPGQLSLSQLRAVWRAPLSLKLIPACREDVERSAAVVAATIARGDTAYGVNTGFGKLAKVRVSSDQLTTLQKNLILSHAAGVGKYLDDHIVRLILLMKISSLARGFSGVRWLVIDTMVALFNAGIMPCIPEKGSVGASGDLAPLAHMTLALLGEGNVRLAGEIMPAKAALKEAGIEPLILAAKEGLALINGTQASTALALHGVFLSEHLFRAGIISGAMSIDAAKGSDTPFDPRIHALRGQQGQMLSAKLYRTLLSGSAIRKSHFITDERVQDPYCLRCQPQVMGACLDVILQVTRTLLIEANAVTDNPLVFADTKQILSGGNFHAEPVALAADTLALALAEIGAIAERRIALLIDASNSGLPAFLVHDSGINSGFMIAHVTAAALASENKTLAHPASVDSLPTSANQEDHVSMATFAARKLATIAENTAVILGIEVLAAAQGIDFHAPLLSSPQLMAVHQSIREKVSFYHQDRLFAPDIEVMAAMVLSGELSLPCEQLLAGVFEA